MFTDTSEMSTCLRKRANQVIVHSPDLTNPIEDSFLFKSKFASLCVCSVCASVLSFECAISIYLSVFVSLFLTFSSYGTMYQNQQRTFPFFAIFFDFFSSLMIVSNNESFF